MFNLTSQAARDQEQARQEQQIAVIEAKLQAKLSIEFMRWGKEVSRAYAEGGPQMAYVEAPKLGARVRSAIEQAVGKTAKAFAGDVEQSAKDSNKSARWERKQEELQEGWLQQWLNAYYQERILPISSVITETMQTEITSAIDVGIDAGLSQRAIGRSIQERVAGIADYQANRIARTEIHSASQRATEDAVAQLVPQALKRWVTAKDSRVRAIREGDQFGHRAMEGQTIPLSDKFQVPKDDGTTEAMRGPGDPNGSPGNTINCRCVLTYEDPEFKALPGIQTKAAEPDARIGVIRGLRGPEGQKGERGEVGPRGVQGPKGDTGPKGKDGVDGKAGRDGRDGRDGQPGAPGAPGVQAKQIADARINADEHLILELDDGTQFDAGPVPRGTSGEDGERGLPGMQGIPGEAGPPGPVGPMPQHEVRRTDRGVSIRFEIMPGQWGPWHLLVDLQLIREARKPQYTGGGASVRLLDDGTELGVLRRLNIGSGFRITDEGNGQYRLDAPSLTVVVADSSEQVSDTAQRIKQTTAGITTTLWDDPVEGQEVAIRNAAGNWTKVAAGANSTIEGGADFTLNGGESIALTLVGTDWTVF